MELLVLVCSLLLYFFSLMIWLMFVRNYNYLGKKHF